MQYSWLNKSNNENLIVFFAGWSFDDIPFKFLKCDNFDVLIVYDYGDLSFSLGDFAGYKRKVLISWSMGVYVAYLLRDKFCDFDKKIAINGTVFPVDNEFGIPEKPFLLTLKHAVKGLEGKFYQNIFNSEQELETYMKNSVKRTIENRVLELEHLYKQIQNSQKSYSKFYDYAFVSEFDKIIPPTNQKNFWNKFQVPYHILQSGHFPYYCFDSWSDIIL